MSRLTVSTLVGCLVVAAFARAQGVSFGDIASLEDLLETGISTASKYKQTANESPASITIITSEEIERRGYRTVAELLNTVRGIYVSSDHVYDFIGTRGFHSLVDTNNRILMLLNGQALTESLFGVTLFGDGFPIDMDLIERVEVVRGPGSILYGTNAMFLVVNVVTKDGATLDGGSVRADVGSGNERTVSALFGESLSNDADVVVSARKSESDGLDHYSPEHGKTAVGADWQQYALGFAALNYKQLRTQALFTTRRKGAPTGYFGARFGNPDNQQFDERMAIQATHTYVPNPTMRITSRGFGFYSETKGRFVNAITRPPRDHGESGMLGGELDYVWDIRPNNRWTVGIEYQDFFESSFAIATDAGTPLASGDEPFHVLSVYSVDEFQVRENLQLSFGARYDRHSKDGSSATSPRAAIIYHPRGTTTLKLLYGGGFRAPTLVERDMTVPFALKPNPNLRPESVRTTELVWEQRVAADYYVSVSAYRNAITDLILNVRDALGVPSQFLNLGSATVDGVELETWARWGNGRDLYANYSHQRALEDATGS
ncbi:MAG: TonB-dependent receptor, partial [Candidatus Poribacteria bacterium]|nr:TonB-dependent receptor [Candidatus Poribacteria bacterium]